MATERWIRESDIEAVAKHFTFEGTGVSLVGLRDIPFRGKGVEFTGEELDCLIDLLDASYERVLEELGYDLEESIAKHYKTRGSAYLKLLNFLDHYYCPSDTPFNQ